MVNPKCPSGRFERRPQNCASLASLDVCVSYAGSPSLLLLLEKVDEERRSSTIHVILCFGFLRLVLQKKKSEIRCEEEKSNWLSPSPFSSRLKILLPLFRYAIRSQMASFEDSMLD